MSNKINKTEPPCNHWKDAEENWKNVDEEYGFFICYAGDLDKRFLNGNCFTYPLVYRRCPFGGLENQKRVNNERREKMKRIEEEAIRNTKLIQDVIKEGKQ